jgi:hypothetical protein
MLHALAAANPEKRTTVVIPIARDPWPTILEWADQTGYVPRGDVAAAGAMQFQKGLGILVAPMMLLVAVGGDAVTLQAWVRSMLFVRIMSLFILPPEMHIRSGGFRAVAPRKIARDGVNDLIARLGGQPIP